MGDKNMAKICAWLKSKGWTAHVDLKGRVALHEKKKPYKFVKAL